MNVIYCPYIKERNREMKQGIISKLVVCILALAMVLSSLTFAFAESNKTMSVSTTPGRKSMTLKWKKVPGAHHYIITKVNQNVKKGKTIRKGKDATKYTNIKLPSNEKFIYDIAAYDKNDKKIAEKKGVQGTTRGVGVVTKMEANPGYKTITVSFKKVKDAQYYEIQKYNKKTKKWVFLKNSKGKNIKLTAKNNTDTNLGDKKYIIYKDKYDGFKPSSDDEMVRNKTYKYRVRAMRKNEGILWGSQKWTYASAKPTRQMYQNIKVNGRWHVANGYSGGTYYTTEGYSYSVNSVSSATCDYSRNKNYSRRSAENFVNELMKAGKFSRRGKSRMIWISTYTQHIYVFTWKNKRWQLYKDWECSTGDAGSPTPMGFGKDIDHKHYVRNGTYYWNCFSSHNAMHGKQSGWEDIDGRPHSHGCVRNENSDAEWIYDNCSYGTPVVSW